MDYLVILGVSDAIVKEKAEKAPLGSGGTASRGGSLLLCGGFFPEGVDIGGYFAAGNLQREGKFIFHQPLRLLQNGLVAAGDVFSLLRCSRAQTPKLHKNPQIFVQ